MKTLLVAAFAAALTEAAPQASSPSPAGPAVVLHWPVACVPRRTCFIQHYVDHGLRDAPQDPFCGSKTYAGHNGTDIRLPDLAAEETGVDVLAAADGTVSAFRDGMADVSVRVVGADAIKGRECGNGVLIQHASGLSTQYCHMRRGSVLVRPGQAVKAGQALGKVGLSGDSEFPHLHFTVRQAAEVVDPFAVGLAPGACNAGRSLWAADAGMVHADRLPEILNVGFEGRPVSMQDIEQGNLVPPQGENAPVVLAYVRAIGLESGDVLTLALAVHGGAELGRTVTPPLDHSKDQYMLFVGARRPQTGWSARDFDALVTVERDGEPVVRRRWTLRLW